MKKIDKYILLLAISALCLVSCKKETVNIFNQFSDVDVTYHSNSEFDVTDYKEVNAGDSVHLDYTITSAKKGMFVICVYEAGSAIPFLKIPLNNSQRRSYSNVVKLKMNTKVGRTSYRVWALDSSGVYMGDGYKTITIDVKSDYNYWSGRELKMPDTVGKANKCYYSLTTGELFNYGEASVNSAKIDMGLFRVPVFNTTTGALSGYKYDVYALNSNPLPFTPYDISAFTKRATLFSAPQTGQSSAFLNLRTSEQIGTAGKNRKATATRTSTGLAAGSLFYALTPEGKYAAIYVNSIETSNLGSGVFLNIDVKIQR